MSVLALEIHDAGLLATGDALAEVPAPSPGYALFEGKDIHTGRAAAERSRLRPRWVHHRFWQELSTEPLSRPYPRHLSTAELAHAHLGAFWHELGAEAEKVLLAVPGTFSEAQLSLLLGIARSLEIPVRGLVESAVAAGLGAAFDDAIFGGKVLHLDLQLHRAVATELHRGDALERRRIATSARVGLFALRDAWARAIAERFVDQTRFDPLHAATTEQVLYDQLPGWLEAVANRGSVRASLTSGGREHAIELAAAELEKAVESFYRALDELLRPSLGGTALLLLSHRAALPGLRARLGRLSEVEIAQLPPGAAARGALAMQGPIEGPAEALPFVTRLPLPQEAKPTQSQPTPPAPEPPTHVLFQGRAHAIGDGPLVLGAAPGGDGAALRLPHAAGLSREHCRLVRRGSQVWIEDQSKFGTRLNGRRLEGEAAVSAGDRLSLGEPGLEVELIRVVE